MKRTNMETTLNVKLIARTTVFDDTYLPNQGAILSTYASKQCYSGNEFELDKETIQAKKDKRYTDLITKVAASGHLSVLEHGSASFLITGVSRALSHQLVRHRLASYTQQSQRYTNMEDFSYIVPDSIKKIPEAHETYKQLMEQINTSYKKLEEYMLNADVNNYKEDIRFILPNACTTQLVMTMNYRELGDFLSKRMCTRAQWEIRTLAKKIFDIMNNVEPKLFGPIGIFKGAKCKNVGFCTEVKTCGKKKRLNITHSI